MPCFMMGHNHRILWYLCILVNKILQLQGFFLTWRLNLVMPDWTTREHIHVDISRQSCAMDHTWHFHTYIPVKFDEKPPCLSANLTGIYVWKSWLADSPTISPGERLLSYLTWPLIVTLLRVWSIAVLGWTATLDSLWFTIIEVNHLLQESQGIWHEIDSIELF